MKFKPGKVLKEFDVEKHGKKVHVTFRYNKASDSDDLMEYINTLVKERAYIARQETLTKEEEEKYLKDLFEKSRKGDAVFIAVEIDGKVIGEARSDRKPKDANRHVCDIGLGLLKEWRGIGIGRVLIEEICRQSREVLGCEIAQLSYFEWNEGAKRLYEKSGFKETGRIPRGINHYGKYGDEVIMVRELRE